MIKLLSSLTLTLVLSGLVLSLSLSPQAVYAQNKANKAGDSALKFLDDTAERAGLKDEDTTAEGQTRIFEIIGNVINVVLSFVGILFFIQLFMAGFRWMMSGGNEEVVKEAKDTIKTSVIGIVVVLSAFVVTNFVLNQIEQVNTIPTVEEG
jgi:hypothetical protein